MTPTASPISEKVAVVVIGSLLKPNSRLASEDASIKNPVSNLCISNGGSRKPQMEVRILKSWCK